MMKRKWWHVLGGAGCLTAAVTLILVAPRQPAPPDPTPTPAAPVVLTQPAAAVVDRIIDGDTLVLTDGRHVRLLGVDTPEKGQCWAKEATTALATLTPPGAPVTLTPDPTQATLDKYGRTLAYVDSPTTGDASEQLARQGAAKVYVYQGKPVQRAATYTAAEQLARSNGLGIWACPAS
jgi:micrococcal nuclease